MGIPRWTTAENENLESLENKLQQVRDLVRGVVKKFHTGLFLWGEGGTSKSYTVLQELQKLKTKYVLHNTRMTGRALFDALEVASSDIHLIEDAETLMDDKKSAGVLRSALWSQSKEKPPERPITWGAAGNSSRFIFTGGVIIISNANLAAEISEVRALKTRINVLQIDIGNEEIRALMKQICLEGYEYGEDYMTPDECWEVASFIAERLELLKRNLDLRLLLNGFKDYLQYKTGNSINHWKTLLESRMAEQVVNYAGRKALKAEEQKIALAIYSDKTLIGGDKVAAWMKKTGLKQAAYYRALNRKK